MTGVERTFNECWDVALIQHPKSWRCSSTYHKTDSNVLRLYKGIEHNPGLHWEVVDLGCNQGKKQVDVRSPEKSPHAGILAAAMLHPE